MASLLSRLGERIVSSKDDKDLLPEEVQLRRHDRRLRIFTRLIDKTPLISWIFLLAGYAWLLALPYKALHRGHYISENAIQPAQVNTYWSWTEVSWADRYAGQVAEWATLPSHSKADQIRIAFGKNGLPAATQSYSYDAGNRSVAGTNAWAVYHAPKTDGSEAIVLVASWKSRNGQVNVRGIATLLALSRYLTKFSLWSKDIIFLISDGYLEGAHAWLKEYHGQTQSNLRADKLRLTSGAIWAALIVDYPYHSFDHLGIYFEGTNGQLPNLDYINSVTHIARWTGGSPVRLHTDTDSLRSDYSGLASALNHDDIREYQRASKNILRQVGYCALGTPSGPQGVFGQYRIDAITLFAMPAEGPHGFHSLGKTIESTLRSLNNLLERFHQSFFLYLMSTPHSFVNVGNYLPGPILVSIAMTLSGLGLWGQIFAKRKDRLKGSRDALPARPVLLALSLVTLCYMLGGATLYLATAKLQLITQIHILCSLAALPALAAWPFAALARNRQHTERLSDVLLCFGLIINGMVLAVASTLNFSLAAVLSIVSALPWLGARSARSPADRWLASIFALACSPPSIACIAFALKPSGAVPVLDSLTRDWIIVRSWTLPLIFLVVQPALTHLLLALYL
ncbi:uncharacterized protein L969DRAFT_88961 [Mixia osmundae IAM 14324]|uniref:Gaa1-like protein n=1 Tax=Mixia osmundae (strain CBS 9802 / IAM 14324 / JCM 22182 / KY 12970) TaxID=764103 RepID=G7E7V4_MIXOS|nr:uncharacterized protein L969DRAFT_88961 [Mixia osmundae IAM 14324]KEI38515.1 hypothetical protein L969DRAFT_88961 [Mixia osmundae IAM 14324]GAA98914.1 hypothetical protein E5Q_05602 [Mixia osmundae IAM 14324]